MADILFDESEELKREESGLDDDKIELALEKSDNGEEEEYKEERMYPMIMVDKSQSKELNEEELRELLMQ